MEESNPTRSVENISRQRDLWNREYGTLKVIPSSTRTLASKALLLFSELLNFKRFEKVLDAGCGIGRNAIYLAEKGCQVDAVDMSTTALNELQTAASKAGVTKQITIHNTALLDTFPFEDNSFDLVIDSYVFCHFIDERFKQIYCKELHRVTRTGGVVFSSVFSVEDEYYKAMVGTGEGTCSIVTDPHNGITKQLYTEAEIKNLFGAYFDILYFVKFAFQDVVLGNLYWRNILVLVLTKTS